MPDASFVHRDDPTDSEHPSTSFSNLTSSGAFLNGQVDKLDKCQLGRLCSWYTSNAFWLHLLTPIT